MEIRFLFNIEPLLNQWGIEGQFAGIINIGFGVLVILLLAFLSDIFARKIILGSLKQIIKNTASKWDDIIYERGVLSRLSHMAPALVLFYSIGFVFENYTDLTNFLQASIKIYIIILALLAINSFLSALNQIYLTLPISNNRPIKGYIQVVLIVIYCVAVLVILSIILGKSPTVLLTGLGAMAAVLILVFKDTILGFVASIQLSANNMVRIGDWVSLPKHNTDGTVIEITLNTVKVQNWDKTISTIPTYALVSESFGNWRGMEESGGRRIKRSINIDMQSVKFCSPKLLDKLKRVIYLEEYINTKQQEIAQYNIDNNIDDDIVVNGRRMTNIGTFRKYLEFYLKNHPKINSEMTLLVRHLQPSEKGIPIEIYAFCNDQRWAYYESIQADIFDHILAVLPEFELRVFQSPTGNDFKAIIK